MLLAAVVSATAVMKGTRRGKASPLTIAALELKRDLKGN